MDVSGSTRAELTVRLEGARRAGTSSQRRLLDVIVDCDRAEVWRGDGFADLASWLAAHLGTSVWSARRWINAAHTLPHLPRVAAALEDGDLSLEKTVELCRFATPETEKRLIPWARRVSPAGIRRKADLEARAAIEDARAADRDRNLRYWWFDDGRRLGLEGSLPADQGAIVASALDRLADRVPDIVADDESDGHDDESRDVEGSLEARRADALVALCAGAIAADPDPDRATVVVHADAGTLAGDHRGCEVENGPVIHPETARRLSCDARVQVVIHDSGGGIAGVGRTARTAPQWLLRHLRHRDGGCTFPGCRLRRYLYAHHIVHWTRGGPTDLDNLILVCGFHHKLLHEHGWTVMLLPSGDARWSRPGGAPYEPVPPERAPPLELAIA
jgi:hypothetical protein